MYKPLRTQYHVYKQVMLPTVRIEYVGIKQEREQIKEQISQAIHKQYGQITRTPVKGQVYARIEFILCVKGSTHKREEKIRLYFDEEIPYHVLKTISYQRFTVQIERVRLKNETDGRVSYITRP